MLQDYYAILEVPSKADGAAIKASYRRLAKLTHPDKNSNDPDATRKFQLLSDAYETLKDASKRAVYDSRYEASRRCAQPSQATPNPSGPSQTPASTNSNAGRTSPRTSRSEQTSPWKQRIGELDRQLQDLQNSHSTLWRARDDLRPELIKIRRSLERLDIEAQEDDQQETAANSWFGYLFRKKTLEEVKELTARRRTERATGRIVLEARRNALLSKSDALDEALRENSILTFNLQSQLSDAKRSEAAWHREREAQEQAERQRQKYEDLLKAHERAKEQMQAQRRKAEEQRRKAEEQRRQAEEQKRQAEEQRRQAEQQRRRAEEKKHEPQTNAGRTAGRDTRKSASDRTNAHSQGRGSKGHAYQSTEPKAKEKPSAAKSSACSHRLWWDKVDGSHECSSCHITTSWFAFRCPTCFKIACRNCRIQLKGQRG